MITIYATKRCPVCTKTGTLSVDEKELLAYLRGEFVQDAFKSLSIPLREQIISGIHPECWEQTFGVEKINYKLQEGYDYDNDGNPIYSE